MNVNRVVGFAVTALTVSLGIACSLFNATPSECIEAADAAGLPDAVIEQLRNPEGLNAVERAALQRILVQAGIDDICSSVSQNTGASDATNDESEPTPSTAKPTIEREKQSDETAAKQDADAAAETSASPTGEGTRIPDDEHRRRCRFWALNNLQPMVYDEFSTLNPDAMDDLDRILWRPILSSGSHLGYYDNDHRPEENSAPLLPKNPDIYCRDYWAEPINRSNAKRRNHGFEAECRFRLEERITSRYERLRDGLYHDDENELIYATPNQYVRIMRWLDLSGDELRKSANPPYRILRDQSRHPYAHKNDWIPTEDGLLDYRREYEATLDLEWLGIVIAAGLSDSSRNLQACHYYYPQLFYGYWVPLDPDRMPDTDQYEERDLPRFEGSTTPIYLPKSVNAAKVRAGYPLGETSERYYLCQNSSETEDVGYYYVNHPAGDYCEMKP